MKPHPGQRAAVANAADEEQVERARDREKLAAELAQADMAAVLKTAEGRRVLWNIMAECGTFASCWDHSGALMGKFAARQELGHWIRRQIVAANRKAFLQMVEEHEEEQDHA